jgi:hypothetical protein
VSFVKAFGLFWWNYIVGDDWRAAAGIAVGLALTWLLTDQGIAVWWLLPLAIALILVQSVRREARVDSEQR